MEMTGSMRARSLRERQQALVQGQIAAETTPEFRSQAGTLLRWWEDTYFAGQPALFARRLRADGLTRESVLPLLAPVAEPAAEPSVAVSAWQTVLAEVLATDATGDEADEPRLIDAFAPFRAWAARQLDRCLAALPESAGLNLDTEALHAALAGGLNMRLAAAAGQTFILRLHAAKMLGRLTAATPRARFAEFARRELIDRCGLIALLDEYPVLGRVLATTTAQAVDALCELLGRLAADWRLVQATFGQPADDRLVAIQAGLGDTHRGGRTVVRLGFASGRRVVYKPRPMAVDVHTQELIAWLNERGLDPDLRTVRVVDRGDYGWMEMVEAAPCTSHADAEAFYRRQGALLLVAYLLDATDFHWENVIAAGAHPVLIDLETLFQAPPGTGSNRRSPLAVRGDAFNRLVVRTGLLPMRISGTAGSADLSGLSDAGGQETPYRVPDWEHENTDEMRLVYRPMVLETGANVPHLDGRPLALTEFRDALLAGFTDAYHLVTAHREALAAPDGPLLAFQNDRVRHVLRETIEYALLLQGACHPAMMRDAADRDFLHDALWSGTLRRPFLAQLTPGEQEDLWDGDVPYFTARVASRDLIDSRGRVIPSFFETNALDRVIARLNAFGAGDLARQTYIIRATLDTVSPVAPAARALAATSVGEPATAELMKAAVQIGEQLAQLAVVEHGEAHWVAPQPLPVEGFTVGPLAPDLYEGTAGIALFLAQLARLSGRDDFEQLARAAYAGVRNQLRSREYLPMIGGFQGEPSMLYAAMHLASLWNDPSIVEDIRAALGRIRQGLKHDRQFDLMAGSAGCIIVMLRLHARHPELGTLAIARAAGRHLLEHAQSVTGGIAWSGLIEGERPLLGLSHGAAGISWALSELAAATGNRQMRAAAEQALAYERSWFDPVMGNWPDFRVVRGREPGSGPHYSWSWCHGAPGIGIARLMMRPFVDGAVMDEEIRAAVSSSIANGFTGVHNLCHGDLGNSELLLLAARSLHEPAWEHEARLRAGAALREAAAGGWRTDAFGMIESPSLMTGLAGAGYQLLRLADPPGVPSVLALEPPAR
jgi:type 2 lantibiotic biosynthesis protein LanM